RNCARIPKRGPDTRRLSNRSTRPGPFSAWVGGNDFNGDGITGDLLPGSLSGQFGRRQSKRDLEKLIADFNQNYANRLDTQRRSIPRLELPWHYEFEDAQFSQDLRISRTFVLREQRRITLLADVCLSPIHRFVPMRKFPFLNSCAPQKRRAHRRVASLT